MNPAITYFFSNYRFLFISLIIVILLSSVFEGLGIAAFFAIFLALFGETSSDTKGALGVLSQISSVFPGRNPVYEAVSLLLTVYLIRTGLSIARISLTAYVEQKITYRSKSQIVQIYSKAHYQFFLDHKQGDLLYRALSAPTRPGALVTRLSQCGADLFKLLIILIILLSTFPYTTCILIAMGLLYMLVIFRISKKVSLTIGQDQLKAGTEETVVANEFLTGIRIIFVSLSVKWWVDKFNAASYRLARLRAKQSIFSTLS